MTPTPPAPGSSVAADGHIGDDRLVDLSLAEEPSRGERTHLAGCATCRDGLAALRRTVELTRASASVATVAPGPQVWSRIEAELDDDSRADDDSRRPAVVVPLRPSTSAEPRRRRPPLAWLAAACAAGVVLGAGGILAADRLRDPASDPGATVATAELDTLDTGQRLGSATVSRQDDGVTLAVSARDLEAGPDGYVEVWLLNRDGKRLVSVGVMRDGAESASFPISQRLLDEGYVVVDVSREQFDDKPQHSGDSIVRGSLTTPA